MMAAMYSGVFLLSMACVLTAAAFFWYASLRFHAYRNAADQLRALPFTQGQANMFEGSSFQSLSNLTAPQVAFGALLYGLLNLAVLSPVLRSVWGMFTG